MTEVGRAHVGLVGDEVVCDHCQGFEVVLPCEIQKLKKRLAPFMKRHLSCPKPEPIAERIRQPVLSPTWPYVLAFAVRMEAKLEKNRHKGDRAGWMKDTPGALFKRLLEEMEELRGAVEADWESKADDCHPSLTESRANEAADVANFAMMIADVCGGVKP